ncbi:MULTISPECIES: hypothetical protein [Rhodomicrobium]|uniref:hypothetical protein n=1 Tax=Rhodomicrobium TaxID=1068 RepID=UPI001483BC42|nr:MULTISPECIES: hypothetical protein [Rhodomicrobium]
MPDRSPPLASAAILTDAASEMLRDAATAVKDAGAIDAEQEIIALADQVSRAAESR